MCEIYNRNSRLISDELYNNELVYVEYRGDSEIGTVLILFGREVL